MFYFKLFFDLLYLLFTKLKAQQVKTMYTTQYINIINIIITLYCLLRFLHILTQQ